MNIYCIEQNYLSHKRERKNVVPSSDNILFIKSEEGLLPKGVAFEFEKFDDFKLYGQCELVLRISKDGKQISEKDASKFYDAITTGINFTEIDFHDELNGLNVDWEIAKGWPGSSIIGEWTPASDFKNKDDINFCVYKNREMMQIGNSELMIRSFDEIISLISELYPLQKDDLIFTGSPLGITEIFPNDALELFLEDDTVFEFEVG
ncbi:MAG: fumarylacetoacetate hydrolase family protein [Ginsengibacter sp.]|jgi:2-keto-4-pentenoate hydratase/2-oxohepta-3-ene-1,7-dioic acid hydratase in catechol pathway